MNKKVCIEGQGCGSPPGVKMADTLIFTAKVDMVDF